MARSRPARRAPRGDHHARREAAAAARAVALDELLAGERIRYPEALPIAARRDELVAAITEHQVVVVAGETGSGKSTQLPKLCLDAGRGRTGLIGHTQPRRVAARSVAARIADELGSEIGDVVGYTVRFDDKAADRTLVRVMTDGVLLAEIQRDRLLRRYDTIIVDEAHERSLNIDFLLGYLAQLLPKRPDLKLIITSATIDTARFAEHFSRDGRTVPVVEVAGRTYPVEVRYRPFGEDDDDRDQVQAVVDALEELRHEGPGDVLVFVSGEREIHDTADALRRLELPDTEVLPLYARLSSAEQQRIFEPHRGRRIVLSTNVAETSLTVPGVRYVVDAGLARISRYSRRLKVQRLPIEPISQASANQRAGRCGRVAPGVCIRLYTEEDFAARPAFTEPEILRTNLASVILQMTAIGLGDVSAFPFVEPPDAAAVRDGELLLDELGALTAPSDDGPRRLTEVGRKLARLPVDPRLARMVVEADRLRCVHDVMVVAAALSIQDPRERPQEKRQAADELHRRFDVAGSDILGYLALWRYLREQQKQLSSNQFRKLCKREHLNYLRVREWQDLFSQLRRAAGELGIHPDAGDAHPDHVHQAVLAGLLSHLGMRERETRVFRGARSARFTIAPGSVLAKKPPRWVMAAELVETNQLWARRAATVQPEWAERLGAHLVKRSYGDPHWDPQRASAVATETVTLYGLPIVSGRGVAWERIDPVEAHELFVRHALVENDWRTHHTFVERNKAFVRRVEAMQARVRRDVMLDDATVEAFFRARVPEHVVSGRTFDRWWKRAAADEAHLLDFTDELLAEHTGIRLADYPDTWRTGPVTLPLTYRYDPGGPLDGVVVHIPLDVLNQVDPGVFTWQIPGHRAELVAELVRSLPKDLRRELAPMADTVRAALEALAAYDESACTLPVALAAAIADATGVHIDPARFGVDGVPAHLHVHAIVADERGEVVDADDDIDAMRRRLARRVRAAIAAAVPFEERAGVVAWDFGELPHEVDARRGNRTVRGYPALLDEGDSVAVRVFTNPVTQRRVQRAGVRRLLLLATARHRRTVARRVEGNRRLAVAGHGFTFDELVDDCITAAADRIITDAGALPADAVAFDALVARADAELADLAAGALSVAVDVLHLATKVRVKLDRLMSPGLARSVGDAHGQLDRLLRKGFVSAAGVRRLPDVRRYVQAVEHRVDRLAESAARDERRMAEVRPLEQRYAAFLARCPADAITTEVVELGWALEELRVGVFAQQLGTKGAVSAIRVARDLAAIGA
jgi:ATP-dependent helicase HrpA